MAIEFKGELGAIRYGYNVVATVRTWRIARSEDGVMVLTGLAEDVNDFMASQQPLRFQVQRERGSSRWPIQTLEIHGASLRATLGLRETT